MLQTEVTKNKNNLLNNSNDVILSDVNEKKVNSWCSSCELKGDLFAAGRCFPVSHLHDISDFF